MSHVIAGLYQIEREIGSGGGGVVYLATHLRLNKQVVLKGDKRSLTANEETLRREVDSLKNLSHTYIPQVYDYVIDNNMVFTVMDYIEGESLNKLLERDESFGQARIVAWAGQLLEAVSYLHKQPPHGILHADIKPANIMLTPQDDIMLIDYNIALMLGEEGAVAVGRSFGYASPEHYGVDYSSGSSNRSISGDESRTVTMLSDEMKSGSGSGSPAKSSSSSSGRRKLLDVRSDIYSIGATLYHLLTGKRPNREALEVAPILRQNCSLALAMVVEKAMNPNPDLRYQTADEMLFAIRHLHDNDPRAKRWKKTRTIACAILAVAFLAGGVSTAMGQIRIDQAKAAAEAAAIQAGIEEALAIEESQRLEAERLQKEEEQKRLEAERQRQEAERQQREEEQRRLEAERQRRIEEMYVLAANSADALRAGDRTGAIGYALRAVPGKTDHGVPHVAQARKALADALGVYDLSDGFRSLHTVVLPSETLCLAISPDGGSFAAVSLGFLSVFDTASGALLVQLPAVESGLAQVIYIDDNRLAYAGAEGLTVYDLSARTTVWTGGPATTIAVSADGQMIAGVNRDDTGATVYSISGSVVSNVNFGGRSLFVPVNDRFGDPGGNILRLNRDGSLLAVSFSNGGLEIYSTNNGRGYIELFDESEFTFFEGGFSDRYFAFSATSTDESLYAVIDTVRLVMTASTSMPGRLGAWADEDGIYMSYNNTHVMVDPRTGRQTPLNYDPRDNAAGIYRVDGSLNTPIVRVSRFESHEDREFFAFDPDFVHDEVRLNARGNRIMLFSIEGFRIYDLEGNIISDTAIPDPGQIYDQQYYRRGSESLLEVTYYDGTVRKYSGDDGALKATESIAAPDVSLYEEFLTDDLRITSPLHGTPVAYSIQTGEQIRELERDAYLTYVAQVGEYVITEYISAYGDRYGLLLDGKTAETLAVIPNLCDIIGDRLIINIGLSGSLRETRLYSTDELIDMAQAMVKNGG